MYLEKNRLKSITTFVERADTPFLPNDLPSLIEKLKQDKAWKEGELTSMVLLKNPSRKIILAMLPEETEVISYQVNESVTFRVLEGKLTLVIGKESFILNRGEMLKLHEKIKYIINSINETALLLTLESEK